MFSRSHQHRASDEWHDTLRSVPATRKLLLRAPRRSCGTSGATRSRLDRAREDIAVNSRDTPPGFWVDLHLIRPHPMRTDSPGGSGPGGIAAGVSAIALTDHDTLDGVAKPHRRPARVGNAGREVGVSSRWPPWGEMHVLGYFPYAGSEPLISFSSSSGLSVRRATRWSSGSRRLVSRSQWMKFWTKPPAAPWGARPLRASGP